MKRNQKNKLIDELDKNLIEAIKSSLGEEDEAIVKTFYSVYEDTSLKLKKNKKWYFITDLGATILYSVVSIVNIVGTTMAVKESAYVPYITAFASSIAIVAALFTSINKQKKYMETWQRHQAHKSELCLAAAEYLFGLKKSASEEVEEFKNKFLEIERKNLERYQKNMKKFGNHHDATATYKADTATKPGETND